MFVKTQFSMNKVEEQVTSDDNQNNILFLKLREQSIVQITEMMDSTIISMQKLEKSLERIRTSTSGVVSAARIWSSFYNPAIVEKLKLESNDLNNTDAISSTQ